VDFFNSLNFENVKDSKIILILFWRISKSGTNHPSIAQRGVSCSKVEVKEFVSRRKINYFLCFENII